MVDVPQNASRMTQVSENLHRLIVERKLRHPGHRELDRAVAAAVAKPSPGGRGWRLDKSHHSRTIDALIALAMAASRATVRARTPELLGWV
jgi:phage terminase large subunit-like protein